MRRSPERHNLARLRLLIGLGQKEMAEIVGCSTPTIRAVELGKLKLSEGLAFRISLATGIDAAWLLENDLTKPPVSTDGGEYTHRFYEATRANNTPHHADSIFVASRLDEFNFATYGRLCRLGVALTKMGDSSLAIAVWRLQKFLGELEKDLGDEAAQQKFSEWNELALNHQALFGIKIFSRNLEEFVKPETAEAKEETLKFLASSFSKELKLVDLKTEIKRLKSLRMASQKPTGKNEIDTGSVSPPSQRLRKKAL